MAEIQNSSASILSASTRFSLGDEGDDAALLKNTEALDTPYKHFPLSFRAEKSADGNYCIRNTSTGHLSVFTLTLNKALHQTMTLYAGDSTDSARLGMTINRYSMGRTIDLQLTSEESSESVDKISMHGHWARLLNKFDWTARVSSGVEECFEWRQSSGQDVKDTGRKGKGWKLVRMGSSSSAQRAEPVVAVWATDYSSSGFSGDFTFVHAGATSELGDAWATLAVLSALTIGKMMHDMLLVGATGT